jgi:hypothetical protein
MRNRQTGGYLAFVIFFLIINVAPAIYRAITQSPDGLVGAFFDIGNISNFLGGGAIIAVVLYFAWAGIKSSGRSLDGDDD